MGPPPALSFTAGCPTRCRRSFASWIPRRAAPARSAVAAAGSLLGGSVDHVRQSVLSILLRARGWPAQYPQARFCFWLREQGLLAGVRSAVERADKDWLHELNNLYVSPIIAGALIKADPSFAADVRAARQLLIQQFPQLTTDISTEQFIEAARTALSDNGELPHTILVLDEVQQYINEVQDRSAALTEVSRSGADPVRQPRHARGRRPVGAISRHPGADVATRPIPDRHRLTDADVEAVTRKVLLHKRPRAVPRDRADVRDARG